MGEQKLLKRNTRLRFSNRDGGQREFVIGDVLGTGGSCIVYDGYYVNNAGKKSTVRIKECYPYKLHLSRLESGELEVADAEKREFDFYKDRIRKSFDVANELHEAAGLTNSTSNVLDIYEWNHTVYIVSSYVEGDTLAKIKLSSAKEAIRIVIGTAESIARIHEKGYLYLDIKPENILVFKELSGIVQLFDFDSLVPINIMEDDITEYRISYSVGFSPVEQRMGDLSQIGRASDIYSLGVLLFYLLFDRMPKATECASNADYDYTKIMWRTHYPKRFYDELTVFFHNTLQPYYKDRYQDTRELLVQLKRVEEYAETQKVFLHSSHINRQTDIIGREKECSRLLQWYDGPNNLLFVTGMGGIGKSSVVRKFLADNMQKFDNLIYVQFKESVQETIIDDIQFCINCFEKDPAESREEYFYRKLKMTRKLVAGTRSILVIDNFDGVLNEAFQELLKCGWKIIIITRSDMRSSEYANEKIEELKNQESIHSLFENNMNRRLEKDDYPKLDRIVQLVRGNTLILTLIAKQMSKSYLDITEVEAIVKRYGFSKIALEKVEYVQDGVMHYEKIAAIIKAVYNVTVLSDEKRKCLKFFSLFDSSGIDIKMAKSVLELDTLDSINELRDAGWIEINGRKVQMHPVIQETFRYVEWTDEYRIMALEEMKLLIQMLEKNRNSVSIPVWNSEKNIQILCQAKSVLQHCGEDIELKEEKIYKHLLYTTILHSPREDEKYIIRNAQKLLNDPVYEKLYYKINLYDYVIFVICQTGDYCEAKEQLREANRFALCQKDNYVTGKYYDMLGDFYDSILNGAYYNKDKKAKELVSKMLSAVEQSIKYMRKSKHPEANYLTMKYMLNKVGVLIRSKPEQTRKIKKLLWNTGKMMKEDESKNIEIQTVYYLMCAWYYTLCEENKKYILYYLNRVLEINENRKICDLDKIDYFYIPAANMMFEVGENEKSLRWLEKACDLCDSHLEVQPYIRRKQGLLQYEAEVKRIWS